MSLRAAVPITAGHAVSVALVAAAVPFGLSVDRALLQSLAVGLLLVVVVLCLGGRTTGRIRASAGHAGLALGSFVMATAHGAGLMLVPALMPFCTGGTATPAADASSALWQALAAAGVHSAAMLAVTGAIAMGLGMCLPLIQRTRFSTKS